jgi:hypothetical protein
MGPVYYEAEVEPTLQAQRDVNCARGLPSVRKEGVRDARVAIVGYGPSLADTWPLLLHGGFDAVWTVSKAHDFLIERGVVPTHHTDSDYREHKAQFNHRFQRTVKYWMATQIHPTYLDRLAGHNIALFHVMNVGTFDARYFKQPAQFDVGLQIAYLAYELGYRDQEWFGMDASARGAQTHAGSHEGLKPEPVDVVVAGEVRRMSTLLVRQALFAERMLRQLPKLKVKIRGDGALRPFLRDRGRCANVVY